jgi:hypothetical protein
LQATPSGAKVETQAGLLQERGAEASLWQFDQATPPPWRVKLSARGHQPLYVELSPDPVGPEALVIKRAASADALEQAPGQRLGADQEGVYRARLELERKAPRVQKPKRTPKNQLID